VINSAFSDIVFPEIQYTQPIDRIQPQSPDIPYLQIVWLAVMVSLLGIGLFKMRKSKREILNNSSDYIAPADLELFLQCKRDLKVCGRINLRSSQYIKTPLTFGFINPIVILPDTNMTDNEKKLSIIHELTHIKHGDLWLKFIAFVMSAVHWFNPFAHMLSRKLAVISEEYCDECVIKDMGADERISYAKLILKVISDITAPQFSSTLSASTKNIKRRLINMLKIKKSRKSVITLSIIIALIICSLAIVYAVARNETIEEVIIPEETIEEVDITYVFTPTVADTPADKMEADALISIFEEIYEKGAKINDWRNCLSFNVDYDIIQIIRVQDKYDVPYFKAKSLPNIASVKANCELVFSDELLTNRVYPILFEGDYHVFTEVESELYMNASGDYVTSFGVDYARAVVIEKNADSFVIEVPMISLWNPDGDIFQYKVVRQNANWVLNDHFHFLEQHYYDALDEKYYIDNFALTYKTK